MKIQVLVSTMFRENLNFLKTMNLSNNCIVINQCDKNDVKVINNNKFISTVDRGLSKSRNLAIKNSNAHICIIADDDLEYVDNYESIVKNAYNSIPDADVIIFKLPPSFKKRVKTLFNLNQIKKLHFIHLFGIISFQISFKRNSIREIFYDERFGAGSGLISNGEENIFLHDCLRKKLNIYFYPINILSNINQDQSSWFEGYNSNFLQDRVAVFYRISKSFYPILFMQYILRRKMLFENLSFIQMYSYMKLGIKKIK